MCKCFHNALQTGVTDYIIIGIIDGIINVLSLFLSLNESTQHIPAATSWGH